MNEITSNFSLLNIWSITQSLPIEEETTVEKSRKICIK